MKETKSLSAISYPATNPDGYEPGTGWNLVWSDEFDTPDLDTDKWTSQIVKKPFNKEWQDYNGTPENSVIDDGYLVIKAIHTSNKHAPRNYTSARLHTAGKATWKYGKFVARMQLPYGQGVWPAFWMLGENIDENGGDTPWPASGEIDIMELYGTKDDGTIEVNIHYDDDGHASMGAKPHKLAKGIFAEKFHAFELEWNPKEMIWRLDGKEIHRTQIDKPEMEEFHQPYFMLLNLAIGGAYAGAPDENTPFPALMYVDWVRVYQQDLLPVM